MSGTKIHPTAFVEEGAQLGENVSIGPFCHIGPQAVIGDGCCLMSHVVIMGNTILGANSKIFPHAILGGDPQNNKHKGGHTSLFIGKNCIIREGVTMHRGSDTCAGKTVIGDNCQFFSYAHVAHDCHVGHHVTFANNAMIGGHVTVGDYVIIGGGSAVHQFVRIGHHAFIGGVSALVGDLIPYGMAVGVQAKLAGLNIIGMKRAGLERKEIRSLRHAVSMLFDHSKPLRERVYDVFSFYSTSQSVVDIVNFIQEKGKRFYCTPRFENDTMCSNKD
ncbi:acyl-[acyl-carrier-protein]-UDP-N-acetylglucosamine O-acyltransferase [Bartonella bacilliformis Peru38]|uniref:Acyl-[acyl-carrier-protein]--UDP-N-acetylglucosamine O-acyltransferase n=2 Tax=Bartonella bacilliformis TaxID=774 RepID=LPXA_BARBK|nr:acyl-ACP--UDP-N-acetylglucosamine O-acyltransferase [Bartonella bacilliformis]A1USE7.1 RecName: Full=Acyl-[acyl-carrier-protein]--UDP-N-acetylglucosamine O-acyltransferase; Short=UDP-N-acetylglucosamine acyltransferase [Bartonella bacilliformis KC583]ABM44748.1 acyl-[acyl-carrier-protein]--UDP-N-acetylglucosamine O-acyltransferase [Bartonella bacilliformis KC583]AMG85720.1 acyl-[acyl-carrier-protein]--UDP-N-acetylglucosamine O-acyltransferase [Bartonella bacilliformis]EKS44821.1 UDP-N-acetyl